MSDKKSGARHRPVKDSLICPYCGSEKFVRRGFRKKRHESIQLYLCKTCQRTFTPNVIPGKHYPFDVIFEAISTYNLGYSLEETCQIISNKEKTYCQEGSPDRSGGSYKLSPATLSKWLEQFKDKIKFSRMRPYCIQKYSPEDIVVSATLAHRQLYRYRFHAAKCKLCIESDYKNRNFEPLAEFLSLVPSETPHQYFQEGLRASEVPLKFSKKEMVLRAKKNYANTLCDFVLQGAKSRRTRHETLQKYMLYNDSVTVATEIPVYLKREDMAHMRTKLGFELYDRQYKPYENIDALPKLITGHIDMLQIRNGQIHILDYKPKASKEKPIEQLSIYAMALSRLTGLRIYEFKCAWFDENEYYEFYPLHVLYKPGKIRKRKRVITNDGVMKINKEIEKVEAKVPGPG